MSWVATGFVKKLKVSPTGAAITKGEKLILFVLADYHNEERGDAWVSLRHLAEESMHSRQGVIRALRCMEEKCVLMIVRSPYATTKKVINRYQFIGLDCPYVVKPVDQASQASLPGLVKPVDQASQASLPGLVKPVDHIFPKNLSNDLSNDSLSGMTPDGAPTVSWSTAEVILEFLNRKTGGRFQARHPNKDPTKSLRMVYALLKRGYTEQQIKQVVGNRLVRWEADSKMREFLRPKTLFGPENFEQYLGQVGATG